MIAQVNHLTLIIIMMTTVYIINTARIPIAGSFNPFTDDNPSATIVPQNESHHNVNLPSLDSIHDHVHHSSDKNETESIEKDSHSEKVGPSLDLIDSHPHSHDDENIDSIIDTAKRLLIQPSIDMLDAQLHGGEDHVHDKKNQTDNQAADLNDFYRWLNEQNQTNQLNRFLSLQKEMNEYKFIDIKDLKDKLNRTIEELRSTFKGKQPAKHDL